MFKLERFVRSDNCRVTTIAASRDDLSRIDGERRAAILAFYLRDNVRQCFFLDRSRIELMKAELSSLRLEEKNWRDSAR